MAGRSFKPASYLTSNAGSPNLKPSPARPPYSRSASNSSAHSTHSTHSTHSDDSFLFSLKALTTTTKHPSDEHGGYLSDGGSPSSNSNSNSNSTAGYTGGPPSLDDTPSRQRSKPIPIEAPAPRERPVYTPLSARGDLPGAYFPLHEPIIKTYRTNQPFAQSRITYEYALPSPSSTSSSPPRETPMSDTTPRGTQQTAVMREVNMKHMMMPQAGKYHPSNYQLSPQTLAGPAVGVTSVPRGTLDMNNLYIPSKHNKGKRETSGGHERRPSDVKRQLYQYQRDMIAAARKAQATGGPGGSGPPSKPDSPKLLPLGSPGPITPFQLEEDQREGGYLFARGPRDFEATLGVKEEKRRDENSDLGRRD